MKEILKELAKHYLGIAAAILIAMLLGIFFTETSVSFTNLIFGTLVYIILLVIAILLLRWSKEIKKEE
jgi:protein-S-isoprenylcysteine O-methyltransferase Ste14